MSGAELVGRLAERLFAVADQAFAVGNAIAELKAVATAVIGSHDTDAVARHIADDHQAHIQPRAR